MYDQNYTNWKALWIGENEYERNKIKEVAITNREDLSNIYLRNDVKEYIQDCDYIIKLDDDDIILKDTLKIASELDFDCYCDSYHTFYDISSGILTQQKRAWIPATCIHKKEHAFMHQNGKEIADNFINSLFYGEHGRDWINYYKNKNLVYANKNNPVYVRVLSPTSITAGAKKFPVMSFNDIDMIDYHKYLLQFGAWLPCEIYAFNIYVNELKFIWENFSGTQLQKIKGISFKTKIKSIIKSLIK